MSQEWQTEFNEFLVETERDAWIYLKKIKNDLDKTNIAFDDRFRKHFLQIMSNRLNETFDRFVISSTSSSINCDSIYGKFDTIAEPKNSRIHGWFKKSDDAEPNRFLQPVSSDRMSPNLMKTHSNPNSQTLLAKNISISGIPYFPHENLYKIFKKLCKRLNADVECSDIVDIYRKNRLVIVKFRSASIKELVMKLGRQNVRSSQILRLPEDCESVRIRIDHHFTQEFMDMTRLASDAVHRGILYKYSLKDDALVVRTAPHKPEKDFVSKRNLTKYIAELETKTKSKKYAPRWRTPEHY